MKTLFLHSIILDEFFERLRVINRVSSNITNVYGQTQAIENTLLEK